MEHARPLPQAVRRKPLPRLPPEQAAVARRPTTSGGLTERLENLQLHDWADEVPPPPPPPRHGSASTTPTASPSLSSAPTWGTSASTAPTLASSSTWASTASTLRPNEEAVAPPPLPSRPPAHGRPRTAHGGSPVVGVGHAATAPAAVPAASDKKEPSVWKTALDETRFFAAGLVHKPFESSKHYTILRHSSGLIMYRGPATSVAVTVFSTPDHPVPADRTVWLQRRGYSGDTGLKLKTLVGASGSWLDVTPSRRITSASDLPAVDERGYQRDMNKFLKKARSDKALSKRQPRETLVVRIPAAAADGYFRLVLCTGGGAPDPRTGVVSKRKTLCGSPVFRVASTSSDASIFRGASLRTLPAEAGVKIVSMLGSSYASTVAEPVISTVQAQVERLQPGTVPTLAAQTAYDSSGVADKLDAADAEYEMRRQAAYRALHAPGCAHEEEEDEGPPQSIGPDSGPESPFPIPFQGRVVRGTGRSTTELGVPTANLADVSDDVRLRLRGVYFGWVTVMHKGEKTTRPDADADADWIEAVITIGPSPWGRASVAAGNDVAVHVLYEFGPSALLDAKLKVLLMGFLRPLPATHTAALGSTTHDDARVVVTSLSRQAWRAQNTLERIAAAKSARSMVDKYAESRSKLQKKVDKIPLHFLGVRTEGSELRDQLYGNGGYWVAR